MKRLLNFLSAINQVVCLAFRNFSLIKEENVTEVREVELLYPIPSLGKWACKFTESSCGSYFTCWGHVDASKDMKEGDKIKAIKGQLSGAPYGRWEMTAVV